MVVTIKVYDKNVKQLIEALKIVRKIGHDQGLDSSNSQMNTVYYWLHNLQKEYKEEAKKNERKKT